VELERKAGQPAQAGYDKIRVSDSEREEIVALLGHAAGEGRLTLEEYNDRAGAAYSAKTRGELVCLIEDLPVAGQQPTVLTPTASTAPTLGRPQERILAIFATDSRKGRWQVPAQVEARSVFGDCQIELQEAQLQHQVTRFDVTSVFGSVTIFAPEGVDIRMTGTAIFGSKESKMHKPVTPGAPVIEVNCRVIFGSVTVRPPKRRWW
jgi:DUF1707 SHOCT-like domain/Cell wall-active antibiotics response LiaF, C-terminal